MLGRSMMKKLASLGWVVVAAALQGCAFESADSDEDADPPIAMSQMAMEGAIGPDPQPWNPTGASDRALIVSPGPATTVTTPGAAVDPSLSGSAALDSRPNAKMKPRAQR